MGLTPFTVESFGGLRLDVDPFEAGPGNATDLLNVDLDRVGRVRTRDGFTRMKSLTMTTVEGFGVYDTFSFQQAIVGYTTGGVGRYEAYPDSGGAAVASVNVSSPAAISASAAGPLGYLYLANAVDPIRRWTGAAFSSPAGMPTAQYLATSPVSDRLVAAAGSRVKFSEVGDPETWPANNFVDVAPGDGVITSMVTWRETIFVFKDRVAFFVFYSESTDQDGEPIFNYRPVNGYGAFDAVAGEEGVYFSDDRTIWLTVGDKPTRISEPVEQFLRGIVSVNGETVSQAATPRLSYSLGRLYVAVYTSAAVWRTLVFDPKLNTWALYSVGMPYTKTLRSISPSIESRTYWLSTAGIDRFDGATTDNGSAIAWSWTSGRYALSDPGRVAITTESSVVGSGSVTMAVTTDSYGTITGSSTTLGTAPATAEGWPFGDQEGTWFQHKLSGTGVASVNRLTHHIGSVKPAGVR